MKRIFVILICMQTGLMNAQDYSKYFSAGVDINKPLLNNDFISNVSKRGFKIVYREFINDRFTVGAEATFAEYNEYIPVQAYPQEDGSVVSTDIYAYVYSYTLGFSGEYFFSTEKILMPYAGFGLGAAYNQFTMFYNVYQQQDKRWGALFRPHGGAILRFGKKSNWGLMADLHFDYATTKSNDTDYTKGFSNAGLQMGLVFLKR